MSTNTKEIEVKEEIEITPDMTEEQIQAKVAELKKTHKIKEVFVRRAINSRADRRGPVSEVLVYA